MATAYWIGSTVKTHGNRQPLKDDPADTMPKASARLLKNHVPTGFVPA